MQALRNEAKEMKQGFPEFQCDCFLPSAIKPKFKIQFLEMNLAKFAALRAKTCKRQVFFFLFFFLHSFRSKITVVKEKAGEKRKKRERKKEENRIHLWLNS